MEDGVEACGVRKILQFPIISEKQNRKKTKDKQSQNTEIYVVYH
jgi:hypothetical protein